MSPLYRPALIESPEQAEALPPGTVAQHPTGHRAASRVDYGLGWLVTGDADTEQHAHMIGWTALVPIEADEEVLTQDTYASSEQLRRFTTPWQRFTSPKETP